MLITADTGRRRMASMDRDNGSVSTRLGRNKAEIIDRRKLEKPETNIMLDVVTCFL